MSSKIWNSITDFQIWSTLFTEFTHMIKSLYRKDGHDRSKQPNAMSWLITENYTSCKKMSKRLLKIMMA